MCRQVVSGLTKVLYKVRQMTTFTWQPWVLTVMQGRDPRDRVRAVLSTGRA